MCTGTYLNARCLCGEAITYTGPNGMQSSTHLSKALENAGIKLRRFKTGTPARMDRRSIDLNRSPVILLIPMKKPMILSGQILTDLRSMPA